MGTATVGGIFSSTLTNNHVSVLTVIAASILGGVVVARAISLRSIFQYRPVKVWKFVVQGGTYTGTGESSAGARFKWAKVAQHQFDDIFSTVTDATDLDLKLISSVYQNSDVEQTIMGQIKPFVFQSQPIDSAVLTVESKGIQMGTFHLKSNGEGTVTNTPCGPFRRIKLTIFSMSQTEEEIAHPIPSKSKVICRVTFGGGMEFEHSF
uniref:Uncharacterized protein n=1 Tax=Attheya septentrionalis TaxID=420275 RepID=A0A7S2XSQ1_9STRA|mmetsp:Transcript_2598/g.4715  ORF Transcript_2598/g.4715 Transcript_2598/m.4715 type:complete len:208 (+) Transcript_2598:821-1444(+)